MAPTFPYVTEVSVPGNYDEVIGSDKDKFLKECSDRYKPVVCLNVRHGSIIISIGGDDKNEVEAVQTSMETDGLNLDSFTFGQTTKDDKKSGNNAAAAVILGVLLIGAFLLVAILVWKYCENKSEAEEKDDVKKETIELQKDTDALVSNEGGTMITELTVSFESLEKKKRIVEFLIDNDGFGEESSEDKETKRQPEGEPYHQQTTPGQFGWRTQKKVHE